MKKIKKIIIVIIIVYIVLSNPITGHFFRLVFDGFWQGGITWILYKDDIEKYVYNSDRFDVLDPSFCCMTRAMDSFEKHTKDSVKVDSMLIVLLSFRDKKGDIRCNDIHLATIHHVIHTHRCHLLPFIEQLKDSFDTYPTDMTFDTKMSYGAIKLNRNIKDNINREIEIVKR
jgi:hypothetical protein